MGGCGVGLATSARGRVEVCFGYDNGCSVSRKFKKCYPATMMLSKMLLLQVTNFVLSTDPPMMVPCEPKHVGILSVCACVYPLQEVGAPRFHDTRHTKVVIPTHRPPLPLGIS